ncbi:MAG: hypothetical protein H7224_04000, partial [Polaromonas sp.]|nr:hypothetical protein [Polaromonas sp.]
MTAGGHLQRDAVPTPGVAAPMALSCGTMRSASTNTPSSASEPHARRWPRRIAWALALVVLVGGTAAALVAINWPSNEALAQRAAQELSAMANIPVHVGGLRWQLLPQPAVVLSDVVAGPADAKPDAKPTITFERITLVPEFTWATLQSRRPRLLRAEVNGAMVPQRALAVIGTADKKDTAPDTTT